MARIYHLALARDWDEAKRVGEYRVSTRGASLDEVGFIHASFEAQVAEIAHRYYAEEHEPLVVLVIDPARVGAEIKVEQVGGEAFPHIYGPLPATAVVEVRSPWW